MVKTDDDTVLSITRLGKLVNKLEKEEENKEEVRERFDRVPIYR